MFKTAKSFTATNSKLELLQRGMSGSYKSRASLRMGLRWGSVLVIDLDGNFSGLQSMIPTELVDEVSVTQFIDEKDKVAATVNGKLDIDKLGAAQFNNLQKWIGENYNKPNCEFNTIVIDTYTQLAVLAEKAAMQIPENLDPKNALKKFGWIKKEITELVIRLKHMPCNLIVNAHEEIKDGQFSIVGIGSAHEVWTTMINEKHRMKWAQDGKLVVQVSGSEGLKTSNANLADAKGTIDFKVAMGMFDKVAKKSIPAVRSTLVFPGEKF